MKTNLLTKGNRKSLNKNQKEFLLKWAPVAETTSTYATNKSSFLRKRVIVDIFPSIFLAEFIYKSDWGNHSLSKEPINNPMLLEVDENWDGKVIKSEERHYKSFLNINDFATYYSDDLTFHGKINEEIFLVRDREAQIRLFCLNSPDYPVHVVKIGTLIDFYGLEDFYA